VLEVRILNGLHRGAICPLDDTRVTIGSNEDADVMLHDPALAGMEAEICLLGSSWWLFPSAEGAVGPASSGSNRIEMEIGKAVSLHGVWVVIADHADAWQFPTAGARTTGQQVCSRPLVATQRRDARRFALPVLALLMIWTTDSVSSLEEWGKPPAAIAMEYARYAPRDRASASTVEPTKSSGAIDPAASAPASANDGKAGQAATLFREKLRELELDGLVSVNPAASGWSVSGELTDEEIVRYKSMLERFKHDYPLAAPIFDSVHRVSNDLPFHIVEASLGRNPSITLSDGQRLFVGDTYGGYRLEAVTQNRIVLAGKHRLTLAW
jgi:type III secretion protein D